VRIEQSRLSGEGVLRHASRATSPAIRCARQRRRKKFQFIVALKTATIILRREYRTAHGSLCQRAIMYKPVLGIVLAAVLVVVFSAHPARSSDNDTAVTTKFSADNSTTHDVQGTRPDIIRAFIITFIINVGETGNE